MKIRVFDSDGEFRGGLFKTHCYSALRFRRWEAPPHPRYAESLIDTAGKDRPCEEHSWFRIQIAKVPDIRGPEDGSDDFDANSRAYRITPAGAAAWLDRHGFSRPPDLIALLQRLGGAPSGIGDASAAEPLPDGASEVWKALDGKVLSAKQLARQLGISEDAVRKRIATLNHNDRVVKNRRGAGYFRPDAPPRDSPPASGGTPESV